MPVNSSSPAEAVDPPAVPAPVAGIDVNFCKNPRCANFGIPANIVRGRRTKGSMLATTPGTAYKPASSSTRKRPAVQCLLCGEAFALKSNLAVAQELERYWRYLAPVPAASCPNEACNSHGTPIGTKGAYQHFGTTSGGTPRYRCRACLRTFAVGGRALKRQRVTHLNKTILLALTNKMPLRRICKVTGLGAPALYGKIDFLHRQCLAFAAAKERQLSTMMIPRLYLSVDRQDYMVNWSRQDDRRNIVLHAVGSADNESGYVFGMHLNFDGSLDPAAVEAEAATTGELALPYPHRRFARLWLLQDYEDRLAETASESARRKRVRAEARRRRLGDLIADAYDAAQARDDTEVSADMDLDEKLPDARGMQVHEEYALYAHFQFLKRLLPQVQKLRIFLDQDSGMRAACFGAFAKAIREKRVDAFYVRIAKEMTVPRKRALVMQARAAFKRASDANPGCKPWEVEVLLMKAEIARAVAIGKWADRWAAHPLPNMSEPAKAVSWQTDLGPSGEGYDEDHLARLFLKASLHAIDNFFQRVRRSVSPLERPLLTASANRRTWYGYSPYNPAMVEKLLDIYRVMHNFVETGKDGKTPAMRLGVMNRLGTPEDIVYFEPS